MKNKIFIYTFLLLTSCQVSDQASYYPENSKTNIPFLNPPQTDPIYPGGMDSFKLFLKTNIDLEKFKFDSGRAYYVIKIDTTGQPTFSELKCFKCEFTNEKEWQEMTTYLNQLTKKMPTWIPATQRGKKVHVHFLIPLTRKYINRDISN